MIDTDEKFRFDTRIHEVQTRQIREGVSMLFQGRTIIHNHDGTKDYGEWKTSGVCSNYGEVYDPKPTLIERLLSFFNL